MRTPERTNAKKQRITLLGVVANESTAGARKLLKKYNEPDALNHKDLEFKLSKLYSKTDDKITLEKEIAEIHPHKEFILHNLAPTPEIKEVEVENTITKMANDSQVSNACGCSNASGGISGVDNTNLRSTRPNNDLMILGIIAIISIFALAYRKQ